MPTIYEYLGFLFRIYTNEHLPVHVHVLKAERESKCELHYSEEGLILKWKSVSRKEALTAKEKKTVEEFINKYHLRIVKKWEMIQIFKKMVKKERVNKL